jgi:NIPSNAP
VHGQRLGVTDRTEAAIWAQRQARQDRELDARLRHRLSARVSWCSTAAPDLSVPVPTIAAMTLAACCPVVELRQYTLRPGQREVLVELFDRELVASQEAVGMRIIGQFRDLDRPDRFGWLRGFADMDSRLAGSHTERRRQATIEQLTLRIRRKEGRCRA